MEAHTVHFLALFLEVLLAELVLIRDWKMWVGCFKPLPTAKADFLTTMHVPVMYQVATITQ